MFLVKAFLATFTSWEKPLICRITTYNLKSPARKMTEKIENRWSQNNTDHRPLRSVHIFLNYSLTYKDSKNICIWLFWRFPDIVLFVSGLEHVCTNVKILYFIFYTTTKHQMIPPHSTADEYMNLTWIKYNYTTSKSQQTFIWELAKIYCYSTKVNLIKPIITSFIVKTKWAPGCCRHLDGDFNSRYKPLTLWL